MRKKLKKKNWIFLTMLAVTVLLETAAWSSAAFSDFYIAYIFPIWVNTYGRVTGIFPFSVGEWLILLGVLLSIIALISFLVWIILKIAGRKKEKFLRAERTPALFCRLYVWIVVTVALIMVLNCFVLYHASTFSETYFGADDGEYTPVELITLYNSIAKECNAYSQTIARDDKGYPVFAGGNRNEMADEARARMKDLGKKYDRLDGWYPRPKAMFFSDFMCQQHMKGYYFPFSMEANYNDVMQEINIPATMCHELAHLRGYIYEDEANLVGYLACMESEDDFFRYSGDLSVLVYLYNDIAGIKRKSPKLYEKTLQEIQPVAVLTQVWEDSTFVTEEEWDRINRKAIIDTETVDKAADVFVDTNLKLNGVEDGKVSYSRVVRLLLQYYRVTEGL